MAQGDFAGFTQDGLTQLERALREGKRRAQAAAGAPEKRVPLTSLEAVVAAARETLPPRRKQDLPLETCMLLVRAVLAETRRRLEAGERVAAPGLGTFRPTTRKARRILNPITGEDMHLPETRGYTLRPTTGAPR
jgi:nucleoid DNA-binding protein